jgi:hypothetical protein
MTKGEGRDPKSAAEGGPRGGKPGSPPLPKVDFSTLALSLGTTALYQLGLVPDPESGEIAAADPIAAQQTIDTLEMLRDKTRGNLSEEERKLIDSLLYELRMRFVEKGR